MGVAQVCGLANVYLLTHALGTRDYGSLAFALAVQSFLSLVSAAGLRPVLLRELSRRPEALNAFLTSYLVITTTLGTILAIATLAAASFLLNSTVDVACLGIIAFGNIAASLTFAPFFDYRHVQSRPAITIIVTELTGLLAILSLYSTDSLTLIPATVTLALKWVLTFLILGYLIGREVAGFSWDYSRQEAMLLLASSWKLVLSGMLTLIPLSGAIVLVRVFHGESVAGILAIAMYAPRALLLFAHQLDRVLAPHIHSRYGQTRSFILKLLLTYVSCAICLVVLAGGALWIAVNFMLPDEFQAALPSGLVLLLAAGFMMVGRIAFHSLIAIGRERFLVMCHLWGVAVFLIVAALLVPRFPLMGAALAVSMAGISRIAMSVLGLRILLAGTDNSSTPERSGPQAEAIVDSAG